jgi:hypothetical protein
MEYYSSIKKNEIMSFAGEWMELENIMSRKVSQIPHTFSPMWNLDLNNNNNNNNRLLGEDPVEGGRGKGGVMEDDYDRGTLYRCMKITYETLNTVKRGWRKVKKVIGGEFDQSALYACMKISQ